LPELRLQAYAAMKQEENHLMRVVLQDVEIPKTLCNHLRNL
jgi:hypothetical protein